MNAQHELDLILDAFFVEGTDEIADRVIDAALDEIDHTQQRRRMMVPRRFRPMSVPLRFAAAAVIGVLVVGGIAVFLKPFSSSIGTAPSVPASQPPSQASSSPAPASPGQGWTATGDQLNDLTSISATLLEDGRVLALGGGDPAGQIYDPATGTWSATPTMGHLRAYPAATRLPDGRVLVAGANDEGASTSELFDPATDTWSPGPDLTQERNQPSSIGLPDGRVLLVGGEGGGDNPLAPTAEIYDPSTNAWTATSTMKVGRANPGLAILPDGRVLAMGGFAGFQGTGQQMTCEIYDPAADTWTATGDMNVIRVFAASTALPDGRILIVGGTPATGDIYDPASGTWTATGPIGLSHGEYSYGVLATMPDGSVYFTTGGGSGSRLDPATGTWAPVASGPVAPFVKSATPLAGGKVLVAEGLSADGSPGERGPSELLDPAALP